jgi:hypothetical protein
LTELGHPDAIPSIAVAIGLNRNPEVEILIRGVRRVAPQIPVDAGTAEQRAGDADVLRQVARNDADAFRAREEEGVLLEHLLVFVDAAVDQIDRLATFLHPAVGYVVACATHLKKPVEQAGADERFEQIENQLPFADAVEKDRRAAAERTAHVHAPGSEPQQMRGDALEFRADDAQVLRAFRNFDFPDLFRRQHVGELARHRGHVVGFRRDARVLCVGQRLRQFFVAAVQVADHRVNGDDRLPFERHDGAEHAVGRRMLRPHVHGQALGARPVHFNARDR